MDDETQAIVMDLGQGMMKTGFAGHDAPRSVFPTIVGRSRFSASTGGMDLKDPDVGNECMSKRAALAISHTFGKGDVENWDDFTRLVRHTSLNELRTAFDEHPLLTTRWLFTPRTTVRKMGEIFFEDFRVSAWYPETCLPLALYASGRTTGAVLDVGSGISQCCSMYEGEGIPRSATRMDLAGMDITHELMRIANVKCGYTFRLSAEKEIAREIKQSLCYVALNPSAESQRPVSAIEKTYEMPDGTQVTLKSERFQAPEILFQPRKHSKDLPESGVDQLVMDSIHECPIDARREMLANVLLCGGSTMFPGFEDRLSAELSRKFPRMGVKVISPPERRYSPWIGGSILASLSTFQNMWISRAEYDERGAANVLLHHNLTFY